MISVHWFRRDLRLDDNPALQHALKGRFPVLPIFIFDSELLDGLSADDARVSFIFSELKKINKELEKLSTGLFIMHGNPVDAWKQLLKEFEIGEVYFNRDYEPYASTRDNKVTMFLESRGIKVYSHKDHVIFEPGEVMKDDGMPYTVYTPYRRKWMQKFVSTGIKELQAARPGNFFRHQAPFPAMDKIGFVESSIRIEPPDLSIISTYAQTRDLPAIEGTTRLGPHLRFGTIGIRKLVAGLSKDNETFLGELIWREFFMQILSHFPRVVDSNFRSKYDGIQWRNNEIEFKRWCTGQTGYPLVDAGMRQLNQTGFMHNRIRMVTASFLCKHLLIDWRWGEAYFASKLLDYELSSNNGNWQWAAGTGCDAAPYFRVFNPYEQQKRFDPDMLYIKKWVPEYGSHEYPDPVVEHKFARERALKVYKRGISP